MNSLIIFPEEFISPSHAVLRGARGRHVLETHALKVGVTVAGARLGGRRGHVHVERVSGDEVVLNTELEIEPLPLLPYELIVAVPRPQTVKKIAQLAAMVGVQRVHFVRSANSQKSYLHSSTLLPDALQGEMVKGLEQSGASLLPQICIHPRFRPFVEDYLCRLEGLTQALKIVATPDAAQGLGGLRGGREDVLQTVFAAVGPERGWNPYEMERFNQLGFLCVSLGERILRVECAVTWLVAQLSLLRELG